MFVEEKTSDLRQCYTCSEEKPLDSFYKDGKHSDGTIRYRRDCKQCYKKTRDATKKPKPIVQNRRRKR